MIEGTSILVISKISSTTGKEEVFDTPVPTVTGEDVMSTGQSPVVDLINPLEAKISRSLVVDGGPNNNILSEFNGPVVFSEKVTSHRMMEWKLIISSYKEIQLFLESIL